MAKHDDDSPILDSKRLVRLQATEDQVSALHPTLQAQLSLLDDDEIAVLESIKGKLNSGLSLKLKRAAGTVGGFVW